MGRGSDGGEESFTRDVRIRVGSHPHVLPSGFELSAGRDVITTALEEEGGEAVGAVSYLQVVVLTRLRRLQIKHRELQSYLKVRPTWKNTRKSLKKNVLILRLTQYRGGILGKNS